MMAANGKRPVDGQLGAPPLKLAKLGEDRVAVMPTGSNVINIDGKSCTHEVCWPPGQEGSLNPPPKHGGPAAREYPFQIDPFQATAINCLEAGLCIALRTGLRPRLCVKAMTIQIQQEQQILISRHDPSTAKEAAV
jgi:hypothetical protein